MKLCLSNAVWPVLLGGLVGVLSGCTTFFYQPTKARSARIGEETGITADLRKLPTAQQKVAVAVYKFRDLTGQYKLSESGSTFSTAITQGTTNILLKALEESGWFVAIERENVSNLLNERKIIRSSVAQFKEGENLPPLLYAGVILEGGVVSYDANIVTGGGGVEYFGAGASTQYRQDRVTVYLRAISTKSGRILKTIYTSKTILSQTVNASLFRYVTFKRLLSTETGLTTTEPGQMAVTEAIEKSVQGLIIEGVRDGLWAASDKSAGEMKTLIDDYEKEKTVMSETDVFGMRRDLDAPRVSISPYAGGMRYYGDYAQHSLKGAYGVSLDYHFTPYIGLQANGSAGILASEGVFSTKISSLEGNIIFRPTPYNKWTSLLYVGGGMVARTGTSPLQMQGARYLQMQAGAGVQYSPNKNIGFRSTISYNQPFTDALDGRVAGARNDYYLRGTLGLVIHIGRFNRQPKVKPITTGQAPAQTPAPAQTTPAQVPTQIPPNN